MRSRCFVHCFVLAGPLPWHVCQLCSWSDKCHSEAVCEGAACKEHARATEARAVNDIVGVEVSVDLTPSLCDVVTASGGELRR
jgi:hypothetical protein